MKKLKISNKTSNIYLNVLIKDKLDKKIKKGLNKNLTIITKNNPIKDYQAKTINNKNKYLGKKYNNITINNNIKNFINNISITTNNSIGKKPKYIATNNSKNIQKGEICRPLTNHKNIRLDFLSMIKNNKRTRPHPRSPLDLSVENSFNYLSFTKKIPKYLSFNQNQKKDDNMKNIKKNKIRNYFLNSNNSQNSQTNNNTIKSLVNNQKISFQNNTSFRNKFFETLINKVKSKEIQNRAKKNLIGINIIKKDIFPLNKLNSKQYNKPKTLANIKEKNMKKMRKFGPKTNILNNNISRNILWLSNQKFMNSTFSRDNDAKLFNSHNNYNRINNIKNDNKLFFRIIFKKNKNQRNRDLENSSTKRIQTQQNLMNSNDNELNELYEMIRKNTIKKDEKSYIDSSLNNTIKFSKCTSKTEEEGELGLDEIQDIIIFYNLGKEIHRDYLFKKNDYFDFKQKYKNIYYKYFMK